MQIPSSQCFVQVMFAKTVVQYDTPLFQHINHVIILKFTKSCIGTCIQTNLCYSGMICTGVTRIRPSNTNYINAGSPSGSTMLAQH